LNDKFENIGIHTHNDCELGVANALVAVARGALMVQGTMNGYGERIGNANLTSIIPNLELKMDRHCVGREKLEGLSSLAYFVSETANVGLPNTLPYVGKSAFAHKGGIHVSAILKDNRTYEHIEPEIVGNSRRVLVSDLSGKSNLLYKIREFGDINLEQLDLAALLQEIKNLEYEGYQFEGAEASLKLLVNHFSGGASEPFDVKGFRVVVDQVVDDPFLSEATVKEGIHLTDYKVRVLDAKEGTAAKVRVLVESTDGAESWTTVGVSANVIEASWRAIIDSLLYKLVFLREKSTTTAA
jgi:2-isopropylmalate synthase